MDSAHSLNRVLRREEERLLGVPAEKLSPEARKTMEETRSEIRNAFEGSKKVKARLKPGSLLVWKQVKHAS